MKVYWRWSQALLAAFLLVVAVIAWITCAPIQVGGQASYVIIHGSSMEPHFHYGDLVIVRQAADYQVGDIVAYRNADIGGNVFHRIVGVNLDRFIFQGDNNSWLDSYQPTEEELIGKLWVHLPKVGNAITWVRVPLNMAFTVGIFGGVIMAGTMLEKPGRKGRKKTEKKTTGMGTGSIEGFLLGLGFLFLASLALGIYSFTRPAWRNADAIQYEHKGTFSYTAAAEPGIYDDSTIQTGEPVFPALTCSLHLQFVYSLSADQVENLSGTHQISARIVEEQSNWQRTIPIEAETEFSGNSFTATATVNLCQVESLVEKMEETTDYHPAGYTLTIVPSVTIGGTLNGEIFQDTFEPGLLFRFDKLLFFLADFDPDVDPLNPSKIGLLQDSSPVPNQLSLFGQEFKVAPVRVISIVGLGLSIAGITVLVYFLTHAARHDQQAYIKMKYGGMLVDVSSKETGLFAHPLEVASIDDLAKIAERNNAMIHHVVKGSIQSYYVHCDGKTYRWVVKEEAGPTDKGSDGKSGRGKEPG